MRRFPLILLLLLVSCGGSDESPIAPDPGVEPPVPLAYSYLNRLPQPDNLSGVSEFGGRSVAVGEAGALVIREPGSADWRRIPGPTRSSFTDVLMVDGQTVLATAFDGTYLSRDAGASWKRVDTTERMREIAFRNGRAIIGGSLGIIFSINLEDWDTATDTPTEILDVGFAGNDVAWAMSSGAMFRSTDGGKNWVQIIERSFGSSSFAAFAFAEENFGTLALASGEVQFTTNGTTFTFLLDVGSQVVDVDFDSSGLGVMVTRDLDVLTSDSRGKSWFFQDGLDLEQLPSSIEHTSAGEVLIVGLEGLIVESSGGVSTLNEISSGFGQDLHGVAFADARVGMAFSENDPDLPLLRTTDHGRSWEEIPSPVRIPRAMALGADDFGLLLDSSGALFRTDDLGETWVDTGVGSESFMTALLVIDEQTWVTGGNGFIAHTPDAGGDWSLEVVDLRVDGLDRFPGTDVVIAVGNGAIRSEDGGVTWSAQVTDLVFGNDVVCLDETTAIAVDRTIFRTTDQGVTWENILDVDHPLLSIEFLDSRHGVAVGEDGLILETIDGGDTWTELEIVAEDLMDVSLRGPFSLVIVGEDGVVIDGSSPLE